MFSAETSSDQGSLLANWDSVLPLTRASSPPPAPPLSKKVFHGLALLLMISLSLLLVELNSPGVASRVVGRLFYDKPKALVLKTNENYSPVPAPFVTIKSTRFMEIVPTSEPTVYVEFDIYSPTSEPTEFREKSRDIGQRYKVQPTSEPTIFDKPSGSYPTYEPTVYSSGIINVPTSEPSARKKDINSPTSEPTPFKDIINSGSVPTPRPSFQNININSPTSEPTIFFSPIINSVTVPTSEPTIFIPKIIPAPSPTSEPTIYFNSNQNSINSFQPTSDPTTYPTPEPS